MQKKILLFSCIIFSFFLIKAQNWEQYWPADSLDIYAKVALNHPTGKIIREYLSTKAYTSILDIPCGAFIDYFGLKQEKLFIDYLGIDILESMIAYGIQKNIPCISGSIENIPLKDNSFDLAYCKDLIECMSYYHKSIQELIRVAIKEVIIVFFNAPHKHDDIIQHHKQWGFNNTYNINHLNEFILHQPKVASIYWQENSAIPKAPILHIYLTP